ncbi:hypothetical protein MJO29_013093 [Puccinia striiformis f. sp. tritici]|nr:hypothetical protein MJO29_013093 [Puccinia striiformis f. sp. tritici]
MSSHPQTLYGDQHHPIEPKRFNGFFSPSTTETNNNLFHFSNQFGSQQQAQQQQHFQPHQQLPSGLQFTDEELLESLIQRQPTHFGDFPRSPQSSSLTQPISFDHTALLDHSQPHPRSHPHQQFHHHNHHHHQPIPITTTTAATSPDTDRRNSFSSSVPIEDNHLLLSPSSTNRAQSPSAISSVSRTPGTHRQTFRSSRSPNPKPLRNRHPQQANNYPFSPPTSITTLVDEDRSPAISTISVSESASHNLSCSQPIGDSFYRSLASGDDSAGLRSPLDRMSDDLSLSSSLPTRRTFSPHSTIDQQKLVLNEKRRKRRESHNAVERRRRDNINDRITELAGLLPSCLLDTVVSPSESGVMMVVNEEPGQAEDGQSINSHNKPNKGMILAKSVDYIKHLKHLLDLQSQRNNELEAELRRVRSTPESQQEERKEADQDQQVMREDIAGEEGENVKGEEGQGGKNEDQSDQIHQWIKIHDQQIEPQNQNEIRFEEENMMMMANEFSNGGNSFGPDDTPSLHRHHSSSASNNNNNLQHTHLSLASSEHPKSNGDLFNSPPSSVNHFNSPFNNHLTSFESIYYHLQ